MYLGNMVELADCDELYDNPQHPYTQALLEAVPIPDPDLENGREHKVVKGGNTKPDQPAKRLRFPSAVPPGGR